MPNERIAALKNRLHHGVTPAMATPLRPGTYTVNEDVILPLVDFLIGAGVSGLFVGGTTGEGILLDLEQRQKLHKAAITAADGRVPVLVHVGAQRVESAVSLAQHAAEAGADGVVAVTPYFYGLDNEALARYFRTLGAAIPDMPLFLYDIPQFAVNGISPALLEDLVSDLPNLAGVKSSRVDVQTVRQLADTLQDHLIFLAGNESAALGLLALGADGLISGLSTAIPEPFVALTNSVGNGNMEKARECQLVINDLLGKLIPGRRLGSIKRILEERGFPVGPPVPALSPVTEPLWPAMEVVLEVIPEPALPAVAQGW